MLAFDFWHLMRICHRFFCGLTVAGIVVAASNATWANDVNNNITGLGGTTFFGALHTDNVDFTDVFTFSVLGPVKTNASLITIGAGLNNIDFISADLNGVMLTLTPNGFIETGSIGDTNLTGPLTLTVRGKSGAAGGTFASYSGTMNVAAVPEPQSCTLALTGLCAMAMRMRRRRS